MSIYMYADETEFQRAGSKPGDLTVGYGVLISPSPVDARVTDEAIAALEADPDRQRPQCKVHDDRTLARRYFHATDDSGNGHSHLCSAIRKNVSGVFTYALVDGDNSSATLEKLYREAFGLSVMELCQRPERAELLVEGRGKVNPTMLTAVVFEQYQAVAKLVYNYPDEPFYCPPVVVQIAGKNSPALQVVDFLLWSCARALSDRSDDVWVRRSEPKLRFSIRQGQGPISDGTLCLDWPSAPAGRYLADVERGKLEPWPKDVVGDWRRIEAIVEQVTRVAPPEIAHLSPILNSALDGLRSTDKGKVAPSVQAIATAFLCIFDTLPLYSSVREPAKWSEVLHMRRTAALIAKAQHASVGEMQMCIAIMGYRKAVIDNRASTR